MTTSTRIIEASATRTREVDDHWPAVGAKLHHSVGGWPLVLDDNTEVLAEDPGRSMSMRARAWPMGESEVVITLTPRARGPAWTWPDDTVERPGLLVPKFLRHPMGKRRNLEALNRFANIAEGG